MLISVLEVLFYSYAQVLNNVGIPFLKLYKTIIVLIHYLLPLALPCFLEICLDS